MLRHPARHELMAYAESLVDARIAVSARVTDHVAKCPACAAEVHAMRDSLAFVAGAPELEPGPAFTVALHLRAQRERQTTRQRRNRRRSFVALAKGAAFAAGLVVVATVCFQTALRKEPVAAVAEAAAPVRRVVATGPSPEAIRKATAEIQTLAAAIGYGTTKPVTLREREQRRRMLALKADMAAAAAALEQNPGCARASHLLQASIQRQAQTLKTLYVERTL